MGHFTLHNQVKLVTLQGVEVIKPLIPNKLEAMLPHCIIWDTKVFLLLERFTATYHETLPILLKD